ncbi:hypothetical protein [Leeuwenhoekiella sp. H156]|uniref:hypothetical protein n=1 Tax=Leeuwenhoekiella sp. H156 TaxID=3450128 RepID=UPI003FA473EB
MGVKIDLDRKIEIFQNEKIAAPYIQQYYIEKHFPWLKTVVRDGKLLGKGKIKPKGCSKEYEILVVYDVNDTLRNERIFLANDSKIQFGKTPHLYPDNSLCLYYPKDFPQKLALNFIDLIPWISEWLVMYELWKKYGVWMADEIKH